MGRYLVREDAVRKARQVAFAELGTARYFARRWARAATCAIVVVDSATGECAARYAAKRDAVAVAIAR